MYARGDTSNVTIPALFTSHTTAKLLSTLIPPAGYEEDAKKKAARTGSSKSKGRPAYTYSESTKQPVYLSHDVAEESVRTATQPSWLVRLLSFLGFSNTHDARVVGKRSRLSTIGRVDSNTGQPSRTLHERSVNNRDTERQANGADAHGKHISKEAASSSTDSKQDGSLGHLPWSQSNPGSVDEREKGPASASQLKALGSSTY
ncbi:hypothetical protein LTS18_000524, partial [Coniosporium uncinatum]